MWSSCPVPTKIAAFSCTLSCILSCLSFLMEQNKKPRQDQRIEEVHIHHCSPIVRGEVAVFDHPGDVPGAMDSATWSGRAVSLQPMVNTRLPSGGKWK